jgi:Tol biopolymer transport system component/DNA-binding winged helix-turn-helix (wHTH) protein
MTDTIASPKRVLRFGTFELDVGSRELRNRGLRVVLADQPFDILDALLEHPGEVVTREALRQRIWATNTFVDFEHGLNAAVHRLREALGDSADVPVYIETVPRRGYRFIAPVLVGADSQLTGGGGDRRAVLSRLPVSLRRLIAPIAFLAGLFFLVLGFFGYGRGPGTLPWMSNRVPDVPMPTVMPLTSMSGTEYFPTFSPDGDQVAFTWDGDKGDNWDIYLKMVGSSEVRRLTTDPMPETAPSWSPNGRHIAFACGRPEPSALYPDGVMNVCLVSPLGGPVRKLSEFPVMPVPPSWSPDGAWLAVTRALSPTQPELAGVYLVPLDGGEPRHLALPRAPEGVLCPTISPDGHQLAFASKQGVITFSVHAIGLERDNVRDGSARRLTPPIFLNSVPAWTRDGKFLVYSDTRASDTLWRVAIDGGRAPERIEIAGRHATWPVTSALHDRLAFVRLRRSVEIHRFQNGRPSQPVLTSTFARDYNPDLSADGRRLVFESDRAGEGPEIWLADPDGSNPVQLTRGPGLSQGAPRWSPDGRRIVFDSMGGDGHWDIWIIEADGASPRRLTNDPADEHGPSWSRDGRFVYFTSKRNGMGDVWRIPVSGGPAVKVTQNGGWLPLESPDGKTLFYQRRAEDSPLLALPTSGGEERVVLDCVAGDGFSVSRVGIHYVACSNRPPRFGRAAPGRGSGGTLLVLDPVSGRSQKLGELEWATVWASPTTSLDGKTVLLSKWTTEGTDLMMIDNFR